jgi:DNA-binding PadR family transcriptional regulator
MTVTKLTRVTAPTLKVLKVLAISARAPQRIHAFALARLSGVRIGSIYAVLARLEKNGWITGEWESEPKAGKPPRHLYQLTEDGLTATQNLLAERGVISAEIEGQVIQYDFYMADYNALWSGSVDE